MGRGLLVRMGMGKWEWEPRERVGGREREGKEGKNERKKEGMGGDCSGNVQQRKRTTLHGVRHSDDS